MTSPKTTNAAKVATDAASKAATDATDAAQKVAASATQAATRATEELSKAVDDTAARVNDFNGKIVDAAKQSGNLAVDTYEKTVFSLLDLQEKFAEATPIEWVADLAKAQVSFARELTATTATTARDLLK
ncbi:hypothetical protein M1M07_16380 [Rhodococcus sp. HM1]|uniref:hypothetical protein n=1 Tax=unclassified Rhodococcus (in: high G+C Gram-positive bacteria) TaxID=192944 RepID=UPI0018CD99D4|nr:MULTISPECIES: hypothetical protein [unclassified Rhodococcus (in: high G+C Gram-positive bacteria)]MBH0119370.1 hypothetical protein [Rhodococcus sp. CX]MCK8672674.1 hypothetical protein [Rhodococcus sp. HM1]